jgi:hypothetical protein
VSKRVTADYRAQLPRCGHYYANRDPLSLMTTSKPRATRVKGIPYGGIRLTDAFNDLFRHLTPHWKDLAEKSSIWFELEHLGDETPSEAHPDELWEAAQAEAEATLRKALSERHISACIKPWGEPITELEPEKWWAFGKSNGIHSNYTSPADPQTPGPDSSRAGCHLPVFLMRDQFANWLEKFRPTKRVKRKTAKAIVLGRDQSKDEQEVREVLRSGRVIGYIVAFFLDRYKPNLKMNARLDQEINAFLKGLPGETPDYSSRVTIRAAYQLATKINGISRKRADWVRLGVPKIRGKARSPNLS